jgi:hypothetical protein
LCAHLHLAHDVKELSGRHGPDRFRDLVDGGVPVEAGKTAVDKITETIGTMPPGQLLDIMSQMSRQERACFVRTGGDKSLLCALLPLSARSVIQRGIVDNNVLAVRLLSL